ncbi:MAG: hypothetical protein ABEJ76_01890 [Halanaeroarchaeum sp.]
MVLVANWFSVHVFGLYERGLAVYVTGSTLSLVFVGILYFYWTLLRP